jgi:hypothetical protein
MGSIVITEQEKIHLRDKAKCKLAQMEHQLSEQNIVALLDRFKNKYNICETVYKVILSERQKLKGEKPKKQLTVDMRQIPYAMNFAGYEVNKELLNELFGASSTSGTTVKKLRDLVTHGIDEKAVSEIVQRQNELFEYMDQFLSIIRNSDTDN